MYAFKVQQLLKVRDLSCGKTLKRPHQVDCSYKHQSMALTFCLAIRRVPKFPRLRNVLEEAGLRPADVSDRLLEGIVFALPETQFGAVFGGAVAPLRPVSVRLVVVQQDLPLQNQRIDKSVWEVIPEFGLSVLL